MGHCLLCLCPPTTNITKKQKRLNTSCCPIFASPLLYIVGAVDSRRNFWRKIWIPLGRHFVFFAAHEIWRFRLPCNAHVCSRSPATYEIRLQGTTSAAHVCSRPQTGRRKKTKCIKKRSNFMTKVVSLLRSSEQSTGFSVCPQLSWQNSQTEKLKFKK